MPTIKLGSFPVEDYGVPYIIAELASNHNGSMALAREMILKARAAGCDCIKFQSWTKDSIFSKKVYEDNCFLEDDYNNRMDYTLERIVEEFSISGEKLLEMKDVCANAGIDFASTPFSKNEADFLVDRLNAKFIKVASMDLNNYPFLEYLAGKGLPLILSTGLSDISEIDEAIRVIEKTGNTSIIILHCVSMYPPEDNEVNINNMDMLRARYGYPVGFSDHTVGIPISLAAAARGACVIEKHFTLDKNMFGWDHKVSADFEEMHAIVTGSKRINTALGNYDRCLSLNEKSKRKAFRRSILAARNIPAGKIIELEDLDAKRPGTGLEPGMINMVSGRIAGRDIAYDSIIGWGDLI